MRQLVAIVLLYLAAAPAVVHATDHNQVQEGIFHSYLKLASEGDVVAQFVVAQRYETGKGTEKDMEKALYWYEMAAKKNYPLALVKLEQYNKEKEPPKTEPAAPAKSPTTATESAPVRAQAHVKQEPVKKPAAPRETVSKPKEKSVKTQASVATVTTASIASNPPKPAEVTLRREEPKQEAKVPAPEIVVAKALPVEEPPLPSINVLQTLLTGKWIRNQHAAEYLPSARTACLQSSGAEIVCFSQEMTRNIENSGLTYNVKSVISGINSKEARFYLRYVYNVLDVSGKLHVNPNGMPSEINDMTVKAGWQEPGVVLDCRFRDEQSLYCTRNDRKMTYQYVRE